MGLQEAHADQKRGGSTPKQLSPEQTLTELTGLSGWEKRAIGEKHEHYELTLTPEPDFSHARREVVTSGIHFSDALKLETACGYMYGSMQDPIFGPFKHTYDPNASLEDVLNIVKTNGLIIGTMVYPAPFRVGGYAPGGEYEGPDHMATELTINAKTLADPNFHRMMRESKAVREAFAIFRDAAAQAESGANPGPPNSRHSKEEGWDRFSKEQNLPAADRSALRQGNERVSRTQKRRD